jgi:hypothetical protein
MRLCFSWLDEPITTTPVRAHPVHHVADRGGHLRRVGNMAIRHYWTRGWKSSPRVSRDVSVYCPDFAGTSVQRLLNLDFRRSVLSLGVASIAIAFASQQIIQNAISGLLIAIIKPIQLEDWVEVGPIPLTNISRVKDITLMNTVLKEVDGRIITVPNSQIINGKVINTPCWDTAVNNPQWIVSCQS